MNRDLSNRGQAPGNRSSAGAPLASASYPSLAGASVFITGGASGIGASMVRGFARQGAHVGLIDIDKAAAEDLAAGLQAHRLNAPWFRRLDVRDVGALKQAVLDFAEEHGGLSVLVNNVADDRRHSPLEVTEESWRSALAINLDPAFFASQAAIPIMQRAGRGSIVNFSSINALTGPARMPAYVSAKSALLGLTKSLARDYGPDGIRVNAILPGWVATQRQLATWLTEEVEREWMKDVALKRRIEPRDVASLALFLASEDSSVITGQFFVIDGGRI